MNAVPASFDRRTDDVKFNALSKRIDGLAESHTTLRSAVDKNTEITQRIETNTADIVATWQALAGGLKVLNWLGRIAKWFAIVAGAISAGYGVYLASKGIMP